MKAMIIDVGSNTVKYDIFKSDGQSFEGIGRDSTVLGFISYIDKNGIPSKEGVDKLCEILSGYLEKAKAEGCHKVLAFATASLRRCADPFGVIQTVREKTGLLIELFSGGMEAEMSLQGVLVRHPESLSGIMADMGGGSTELNFYKNKKSIYLVSNPFGALSLKNEFVKDKGGALGGYADEKELRDIYSYAKGVVASLDLPSGAGEDMFIVGGSARAIGALVGDLFGNCEEFTLQELKGLAGEYSKMSEEKAELLRALTPQREYLVIPAVCAFIAIAEVLGIKKIKVASGGIREGYMSRAVMGEEF